MANAFNQLLAGLSGGFTGYEQDQQRKVQQARQATNDQYLNEDRASQRALREAQTGQAAQRAQQDAFLRTPEFQSLYQQARGGDEAALSKVASAVAGHPDATTYMNSLTREPKAPTGPVVGSPEWEQAKIKEAQIGAKYGYHPPVQEPLVATKDPSNPTAPGVYTPRSQAVGRALPERPAAGGVGNAQNAASEALLRSSVSEMGNADNYMRSYENDLASGKKSITGLSQFIGGIGNSFTHDDPASRAIQGTALTALNTVNPELARYIRRGLSFAEGESGISKRPSDFRTKMAAFLSTASSGASPELIADIQGRRASILTPLHDVVGKMTGQSSGNVNLGAPTPHVTPAERAALKAQGYTDAQIDAYKP